MAHTMVVDGVGPVVTRRDLLVYVALVGGTTKVAEEHVVALVVGSHGDAARWPLCDPCVARIEHAMLKVHGTIRLGSREALERQDVAIVGDDLVVLVGIACLADDGLLAAHICNEGRVVSWLELELELVRETASW